MKNRRENRFPHSESSGFYFFPFFAFFAVFAFFLVGKNNHSVYHIYIHTNIICQNFADADVRKKIAELQNVSGNSMSVFTISVAIF